jgi:hypothetical protein
MENEWRNTKHFLKRSLKLIYALNSPSKFVFSFREALEHENVTFNLNGTLSYIPRRFPLMTDKLVLDTSLGRGLEDRLVVPNIPLLVNNSLFRHA